MYFDAFKIKQKLKTNKHNKLNKKFKSNRIQKKCLLLND